MAGVLLDPAVPAESVREEVFRRFPEEQLGALVEQSRGMDRTEAQALFAILRERFPQVRAFVPDFLETPRFESPEADNQLLAALEILRRMGSSTVARCPLRLPAARLEHLPEVVAKAQGVKGRLPMIERAGQGCAIGSALLERIHQPYIWEGQRTGALRFGDPRAMALTGALCVFVHAVAGFTNKSLRGLVAGLLGRDYTTNQMTYDLRPACAFTTSSSASPAPTPTPLLLTA